MFSRIKKDKSFSEKRTKFYAAQIFLALEELHSLGYVYRDLKPENVLFDSNGYIKVSDYGLAKELKKGEKTYSLTGTASYLSSCCPTQARRSSSTRDIPSLSTGGPWGSLSTRCSTEVPLSTVDIRVRCFKE